MSVILIRSVLSAMLLATTMMPTAPSGAETAFATTHPANGGHEAAMRAVAADEGCALPDCERDAHCATMPVFDCGMSGSSCSVCGASVLLHHTGSFVLERSIMRSLSEAQSLQLRPLSARIFHPPRLS